MELWTPKILQFDTTNRRVTMIKALVNELVDKMFDLCPVDTGALRNSIVAIVKTTNAGGAAPLSMTLMVPAGAALMGGKAAEDSKLMGGKASAVDMDSVVRTITVSKGGISYTITGTADKIAANVIGGFIADAMAMGVTQTLIEELDAVAPGATGRELTAAIKLLGMENMANLLKPSRRVGGWAVLIADLADDLIAAQATNKGNKEPAIPDARVTAQVYLSMLNYGEIVEFGTLTRSPSPFIRPVLHQHSCLIEDLGGEILI